FRLLCWRPATRNRAMARAMRADRSGWWPLCRRLTVVGIVSCIWTIPCGGDEERLWVRATINGKPVQFAFDTGASHSLLLPKAAERLGLAVTNAPKDVHLDPGEVPMGRTEECDVAFGGETVRASFGV